MPTRKELSVLGYLGLNFLESIHWKTPFGNEFGKHESPAALEKNSSEVNPFVPEGSPHSLVFSFLGDQLKKRSNSSGGPAYHVYSSGPTYNHVTPPTRRPLRHSIPEIDDDLIVPGVPRRASLFPEKIIAAADPDPRPFTIFRRDPPPPPGASATFTRPKNTIQDLLELLNARSSSASSNHGPYIPPSGRIIDINNKGTGETPEIATTGVSSLIPQQSSGSDLGVAPNLLNSPSLELPLATNNASSTQSTFVGVPIEVLNSANILTPSSGIILPGITPNTDPGGIVKINAKGTVPENTNSGVPSSTPQQGSGSDLGVAPNLLNSPSLELPLAINNASSTQSTFVGVPIEVLNSANILNPSSGTFTPSITPNTDPGSIVKINAKGTVADSATKGDPSSTPGNVTVSDSGNKNLIDIPSIPAFSKNNVVTSASGNATLNDDQSSANLLDQSKVPPFNLALQAQTQTINSTTGNAKISDGNASPDLLKDAVTFVSPLDISKKTDLIADNGNTSSTVGTPTVSDVTSPDLLKTKVTFDPLSQTPTSTTISPTPGSMTVVNNASAPSSVGENSTTSGNEANNVVSIAVNLPLNDKQIGKGLNINAKGTGPAELTSENATTGDASIHGNGIVITDINNTSPLSNQVPEIPTILSNKPGTNDSSIPENMTLGSSTDTPNLVETSTLPQNEASKAVSTAAKLPLIDANPHGKGINLSETGKDPLTQTPTSTTIHPAQGSMTVINTKDAPNSAETSILSQNVANNAVSIAASSTPKDDNSNGKVLDGDQKGTSVPTATPLKAETNTTSQPTPASGIASSPENDASLLTKSLADLSSILGISLPSPESSRAAIGDQPTLQSTKSKIIDSIRGSIRGFSNLSKNFNKMGKVLNMLFSSKVSPTEEALQKAVKAAQKAINNLLTAKELVPTDVTEIASKCDEIVKTIKGFTPTKFFQTLSRLKNEKVVDVQALIKFFEGLNEDDKEVLNIQYPPSTTHAQKYLPIPDFTPPDNIHNGTKLASKINANENKVEKAMGTSNPSASSEKDLNGTTSEEVTRTPLQKSVSCDGPFTQEALAAVLNKANSQSKEEPAIKWEELLKIAEKLTNKPKSATLPARIKKVEDIQMRSGLGIPPRNKLPLQGKQRLQDIFNQ